MRTLIVYVTDEDGILLDRTKITMAKNQSRIGLRPLSHDESALDELEVGMEDDYE